MPAKRVPWYEAHKPHKGLATNQANDIVVQREALPIIFVPGVMGSRLRRPGTKGEGKDADGLPNLRWDPTAWFLYWNFSGCTPAHRKSMLIGEKFEPDYLEVDDENPVGDGFRGLMKDYRDFLEDLRDHDWGALGKAFVFPVYGFGYNWTGSNRDSGQKLAERIDQVIAECRTYGALCEQVILITHSMGGVVARAACRLAGAEGKVLGVIHGVQPALGAPAAYWRIKAGFEADGFAAKIASRFLGPTGRDVTALLGNSIGGLQLLPTKHYRTEKGQVPWLFVSGLAAANQTLPKSDPYEEIYSVPAVVKPPEGRGFSDNKFWGLVDKELLTPERVATKSDNELDDVADAMAGPDIAWNRFIDVYLPEARSFHDELGIYSHPQTRYCYGSRLHTAETIRLEIEPNEDEDESYPKREFRGFLRGPDGASLQAVLQDPDGNGDGTVPVSSARFPGGAANGPPPNIEVQELEHQPAYEKGAVQRWTVSAITALCKLRFEEKQG